MQLQDQRISQPSEDEFDLFGLLERLWQQKLAITLVCGLVVAAGALYAFTAPPVYKSTAVMLPPTPKDIAELQQLAVLGKDPIERYSPAAVYNSFLINLDSNRAKRLFLQQEDVSAYFTNIDLTPQAAWTVLNEAIHIKRPKNTSPTSVEVSFQLADPALAAQWTNRYIAQAIELTRHQLASDLNAEINTRRHDIQIQIDNKHALYDSELNIELSKLREALAIAQDIGLENPMLTDTVYDQQGKMMVDEIRRLYRLGSQALQAEINALKGRQNHEAFIPGLIELKHQQGLLDALRVKSDDIDPATIDLAAEAPDHAIKPQKLLILALSLILGGMLGLMLALTRSAIHNHRATQATT